ncbi:YceD family protein [Gillisia marina]|uniref:YceD family protein n=1 Tax=Gillisia marina TaxID=1167637 RepID=UPI00029B4C55|nr:DUF177 domain-containing protein [Gillisia marina]
MRKLAAYTIPFVGLKIGSHEFDYEIGSTFFEYFEYEDFNSANLHLDLVLEKKATMMELFFETSGTVNLNCDLTNEPFNMPIESSFRLVVNFGDEYNDENEELLILPHGEYEINIAQYVYEIIVLAVPYKRIHPGIEDGTLKSDVLDKLEELSPKGTNEDNDSEENIDPRWNKLKNLLNDK